MRFAYIGLGIEFFPRARLVLETISKHWSLNTLFVVFVECVDQTTKEGNYFWKVCFLTKA